MKNVNHTKNVNANGVQESHLAKKNDLKVQRNPLLRFSVSLALSLFIVYTVFQIQTTTEAEPTTDVVEVIEDIETYVPVFQEEVVVVKELDPEPVVKQTLIIDKIKEVDNDHKELKETVLITSTEPVKVTQPVVNTGDIDVMDDDEPIEEVPFAFIEDAPIFPGCEKYKDKNKQKKCMSDKIQKHVNRKFNTGIASDVGLDEGVKRINVLFMIDENGNVTGIQARAPHPKLQKEAERVVRLLPKMIPGKQRNQNVKVKYTLPIIFRVD
ncbi:energy transducer TonB [Kordia sp.]|uniref:energy transducer TonB n=1 Tax=Kordia sp. TaxID=1965332 RepID=UPI003B59E1C9